MINLEREPLRGEVEVDETWIGGTQAGLRGSQQLKGRKAALVLVAVEKRGRVTGRARMAVIPDFKRATLLAFLKENVALGSTVYTDGLKTFAGLQEAGFQHVPRPQPLRIDLRKGANSVLPLADRAIGNLQQRLIGTYHGVSRDQLQVYLDEFVFRHKSAQATHGRVPDPARSRDRAQADRVSADTGRHRPFQAAIPTY
jgi:transposase-like protein